MLGLSKSLKTLALSKRLLFRGIKRIAPNKYGSSVYNRHVQLGTSITFQTNPGDGFILAGMPNHLSPTQNSYPYALVRIPAVKLHKGIPL